MLSSWACTQNTAYDADAPNEAVQSALLELPWDLRGPTDGRPKWKGQKMRPSGRYANRGGFSKRAKRVYVVSGKNWKFHKANKNGPL